MADTSRFWDGTTTGDAGPYTSAAFRRVMESITGYNPNASNISVGYVPGTGATSSSLPLRVTESSPASLSVDVEVGQYWMFGAWYENDAEETLAITANSSGNPRIDSIVLEMDWSLQTIELNVITGTPASSPSAPTLTQTIGTLYQQKIADVDVANGASTITNAEIDTSANVVWGNGITGATRAFLDKLETFELNGVTFPSLADSTDFADIGDRLVCSVYMTAQQALSTGYNNIDWDAERVDTLGGWALGGNSDKIILPSAGTYLIVATMHLTSNAGLWKMRLRQDTTTLLETSTFLGSEQALASMSVAVTASASDEITLSALKQLGGDTKIVNDTATTLTVVKLS